MNRVQLVIAGALLALGASAGMAEATGDAAGATPAAASAAALPGKTLFDRHCSFCHAAGPGHAGTMRLAEARGADKAVLEERRDLDPVYVRLVVRQGLIEMPPWRKTEIDDAALQQIAAYLTRPRN
jgi:mono/diheme cytochrome c family protein